MKVTQIYAMTGNMIKTKRQLVEETGWSKRTVETRLAEIEAEQRPGGRYENCNYCVNHDGGLVSVNVLVWVDYLKYRKHLSQKNLRKNLPPYDPCKVAREYGFFQDKEEMMEL